MDFEWDSAKAASNHKKHGVTFEEARLVFDDPYALFAQDRVDEETGESRWQVIGRASTFTVLLVAHTIRGRGGLELVRIISARKAVREEAQRYVEANS